MRKLVIQADLVDQAYARPLSCERPSSKKPKGELDLIIDKDLFQN